MTPLNGSHWQTIVPFFTFEPFLRLSDDPYGMLLVLKTLLVFTSKIFISVVLEITISASLPSESFP